MRTTKLRNHVSQRGSQLVELALVMPILLILGLIVSEGAGMVRTHQVLNNAAREGARLSILETNKMVDCVDCAYPRARVLGELKSAVITYANANGVSDLTADEIAITQECQIPTGSASYGGSPCSTGCASGSCFKASQVTITHTYEFPYFTSVFPSVVMHAEAEFRNLYE